MCNSWWIVLYLIINLINAKSLLVLDVTSWNSKIFSTILHYLCNSYDKQPFFDQKWKFWVFNFKKSGNLQDSDSVRWSSSLAPSGHTNNLLTRFNKSVLFAIIHTILDPFINIFGPIFSTLIWNNGKNILTDVFLINVEQ